MKFDKIVIEFIPQNEMRYDTCGDWFIDKQGSLVIQVSDTAPEGHVASDEERFLIALHELVEVKLCQVRGITQKQVDDFDLAFTGEGEPGDDPAAPYRAEHRQAMLIEHMMANFLGLTDYGSVY